MVTPVGEVQRRICQTSGNTQGVHRMFAASSLPGEPFFASFQYLLLLGEISGRYQPLMSSSKTRSPFSEFRMAEFLDNIHVIIPDMQGRERQQLVVQETSQQLL